MNKRIIPKVPPEDREKLNLGGMNINNILLFVLIIILIIILITL